MLSFPLLFPLVLDKTGSEEIETFFSPFLSRSIILNGADLTEVDIRGVKLHRAQLADANMRGVDLSELNLSLGLLQRAQLTKANLTKANLSTVDLTDADLRYAKLIGTIFSNTTCPDGSNSDTNGLNACEAIY